MVMHYEMRHGHLRSLRWSTLYLLHQIVHFERAISRVILRWTCPFILLLIDGYYLRMAQSWLKFVFITSQRTLLIVLHYPRCG